MNNVIDVDKFGAALRKILINSEKKSVLISRLDQSDQAADIHNINSDGFGRLWHKSIAPEKDWGEIVLPHYPASWKLGISLEEASLIQVYQLAGCNYRCWFCYVDYSLLKADLKKGSYFSANELVSKYEITNPKAKVIRLSGGQPDLVPEWCLWMMKALEYRDLHNSTYLWLDDNLSSYYAWEYLTETDSKYMLNYKNFGRVGCLKGIDPEAFTYNTKAPKDHFWRQLDVLGKLVKSGFDIYVYLVMTVENTLNLDDRLNELLDNLQEINVNLPLRVSPLKIKPFSPTIERMNDIQEASLEKSQFVVLEKWKGLIQQRFSASELEQKCYEVSIN